jgi:predicted phosphodiesterase
MWGTNFREEIQSQFPNRTWLSIKCKASTLGLKKNISPITKDISAEDLNILGTVKKHNLTSIEINNLFKSPLPLEPKGLYNHSSSSKHIKIGILSDTHIGVKQFDEKLFAKAGYTFKKEKVSSVYHAGDILEGMSGRDGNIYDLNCVGFSNQISYAVKLWQKYFTGLKTYGIIGNHDLWFKIRNNGGINVGEELESRLKVDNFEYLGENEADVKLAPQIIMKLFHPNDATAYATSYKLQKLVESLESGRKPNILIEGHYHKSLYMFHRNVHGIEAGTICGQTTWMRGKKIPAHKGFWILDIDVESSGISELSPTFYPAYE